MSRILKVVVRVEVSHRGANFGRFKQEAGRRLQGNREAVAWAIGRGTQVSSGGTLQPKRCTENRVCEQERGDPELSPELEAGF